MNNYDQILSELRTNVARKNHLRSILPEMQNQKIFLVEKVETLKASKLKEDKDVEKMENGSLASFFYNVVGKKDQKLDKERKEAYEATVKYDLAVSELYALEGDIASMERELRELEHCEEEYQEALKQKLCYIKDTDTELGAKVQDMEEKLGYLEVQKVEIQEAIRAGELALEAAQDVINRLESARGWSTWDMFGGGMIADMAKYNALNDAQQAVEILQTRLNRFQTELIDITIHADFNVRIEGFVAFADCLMDGLLTDGIVRSRIYGSLENIQSAYGQITRVLKNLKEMQQRTISKEMDLKRQLEEIVL